MRLGADRSRPFESSPTYISFRRRRGHDRRRVAARRAHRVGETAKHYLNTTLSLFLAFIVSIGTTPVRGTYAYFTNTQQNTGNAFTTDTLQPPTAVAALLAGSSVTVSWTPPTATYVNGYDVYSSTDGADFSTLAGSTSAGVTAFTHNPATTSVTTYTYKVRSKAGQSGAWTSPLSTASNSVNFTPTTPKLIPPLTPASGTTMVATNASAHLTFSEPMHPTSTQSAFSLWPCSQNSQECVGTGAAVSGSNAWRNSDRSFIFDPTSDLSSNQWYRASVGSGASGCSTCAKDSSTGSALSDSALEFNGTNTDLTVADDNELDFTSAITIEAWIKPDVTVTGTIVGKWDPTDNRYAYALYSEGTNSSFRLYSNVTGTNFVQLASWSSTPAAGQWSHIAATYDGANAYVYLNGEQVASQAATHSIQVTTGTLLIGNDGNNARFDGQLDEIRLWSTARTQAQIQQDAWSRLTGSEVGLVAYYRFEEGTGGVASDSAGTAQNGTIGGTGTWHSPGRVPPTGQTWVFKTGANTDLSAPRAPTMSSPVTDTQVTAGTFTLAGALDDKTYGETVLADVPVGYWRLGESVGGTASDSSGNARDGAYNNVTLGTSGALTAEANNAATFSGSSNVQVALTAALNPAVFSVEAWANVTGGAGTQVVANSRVDTTTKGYALLSDGSNWRFNVGDGDASWIDLAGPAISSNVWTHLVGTYDGTTARFYVNGSLQASAAGTLVANDTNPLRIGQSSVTTDQYFTGAIDEVAVYNTALSATRVLAHYNAQGGADSNSLIKVYRDESPVDVFTTSTFTHLPQYDTQLNGGLTSFSIPVELSDGPNRFALTATDSAGRESTPKTQTSLISRTTTSLVPGQITLATGATSIVVNAPFSGDADADSSATVRWKLSSSGSYASPCPTAITCPVTMSRTSGASPFTYSITGLTPDTYDVEVTYSDGDGIVSGAGASTQSASAIAGTSVITSITQSPSAIGFASRAGQALAITAVINVTDNAKYVSVVADTSSPKTLYTCQPLSSQTINVTWDGTDGSSNAAADGTYSYTVGIWTAADCLSGQLEKVTKQASISNAASVALDPLPATVTLGSSQYACVTATVRNAQGGLVPDGVPVQFLFTVSGGNGSYRLTGATSGINVSAQSTIVTSNTAIGISAATGTPNGACAAPPSGSGKAVAKMGVDTASTTTNSTITVKGQVITQLSGTTTSTVSNATTINDPPDAPTGLVLTPGSIKVSFQSSPSSVTVGYFVHLGVSPGRYDRKLDIGNRTSYSIEDVTPGQRYWVAVQAYDKLGQTSAMSTEASLVAPPRAAASTVTLDATSRTPGAPLRLGAIVRARVLDAAGTPVGGAPITLQAGAGTRLEASSMITDVNGEVATGLTVDDQTLALTHITGTSGSASGSLDLVLLPQTPTPSPTAIQTATVTGTVVVGTTTPVGTPASATVELTPIGSSGTATAIGAPVTGTTLAGASGASTATTLMGSQGTPTPTPLPAASPTASPLAPTSPASTTPPASASVVSGGLALATSTPVPPQSTASTPAGGVQSTAGATSTSASSASGTQPAAGGAGATAGASGAAQPTPAATTAPAPSTVPASGAAGSQPTSAPSASGPTTSAHPTAAPQSAPPTSAPSTSSSQAQPTSAPSTSGSSAAPTAGGTSAGGASSGSTSAAPPPAVSTPTG